MIDFRVMVPYARTMVDVKSLSRLKRGCLVFGCVIETSEEFYES